MQGAGKSGGTAGLMSLVPSRDEAFLFFRPPDGGQRRLPVTEDQKQKMKIQARMFDMGQSPKERVVNRVFNKVVASGVEPTDEKLREALADEQAHEHIQDLYG
jgi:hypothetical protein